MIGAGILLALVQATSGVGSSAEPLAARVEIVRTDYGVPHIYAEDLRAAGYALGWVQLEDYGERVPRGLIGARGELARHTGRENLDRDFANRLRWRRALDTYHLLDQDTRDVYEGFAAGVNRYLELHAADFAPWIRPDFTGYDVHAYGVSRLDAWGQERLIARLDSAAARAERTAGGGQRAEGWAEDRAAGATQSAARRPLPAGRRGGGVEEGSNAWALAPSRTRSREAILLRNPHLSWDAGYYEAHLVVPGKLNFYGDFRIGSPIWIVGGFNDRLGWATTNNAVDTDEVYALEAAPDRPDHYILDGAVLPLERETVTVEFRNGEGVSSETRELWTTPLGPVVHRAHGKIYVLRAADAGEWKTAMQFLRMMQARTLAEWKAAMRLRGWASSNFTYADADGNIFYVWNGSLPLLPHASGGDTTAVPVRRSADVWTRVVAWDSLPQLHNPKGGYLHNENDSFHYTNLNRLLDPAAYPSNAQPPELDLRSQHGLELIGGRDRLSLEDVLRRKHSYRMLLAERVKADLLAAVRAAPPSPELTDAAALLEAWDDTAAPDARGAALFATWWEQYLERVRTRGRKVETDPAVFREPWTHDRATSTPLGLSNPEAAVEALGAALDELEGEFGTWDLAWGDVVRVRRGGVDAPVGGCPGDLGCFRVLWFEKDEDGKYAVRGGDGWVLAVEFTDPPRAYSVLAYGQSDRADSPHHDDQAALFARGELKPVAFTRADVERRAVRRYRPGTTHDEP